MNISKEMLKRLVLSKYMITRAREQLDRSEMFASGLAVLNIQDGAELLLRAVAEHIQAQLPEAFDKLIEKINETGSAQKKTLRYVSMLKRMNKARVNFKHHALDPPIEEVRGFSRDTELFFADTVREFFNLDPESISLVSLIGHQRTENWMRQAEAAMDGGAWADAIEASAIAFTLYRSHSLNDLETRAMRELSFRSRDRDLSQLTDQINSEFKNVHEFIDLLTAGVNLADYRRFSRLIPKVFVSDSGGVRAYNYGGPSEVSESDGRFCLRFALDAILQMKRNHTPSKYPTLPQPDGTVLVVKQCHIVVWPEKDPELIRDALPGEILERARGRREVDGHTAILFEGDLGWVPNDSVESGPK
jgi:hypothetical protein